MNDPHETTYPFLFDSEWEDWSNELSYQAIAHQEEEDDSRSTD